MDNEWSDMWKFSWRKELKEIFLVALIGIPWGILMCLDCFNNPKALASSMLVSAIIWVVLWKGNSITARIVDFRFSWLKEPVTRVVIGVLSHAIITIIVVFLLFQASRYFLNISLGNVYGMMISSVSVTLLVSLIVYSRSFLLSWRQVAVESEKMEKEGITARYEVLKNQVNPHFLFNSLNTLTNLVYEDPEIAAGFIKKLSEVYRYVLDTRDKETVTLEEEMKFVKSYIFLQQLRYESSLEVEMDVDSTSGTVVPLSIQMLVENAIKHNVISEDEPLSIKIYRDIGSLIVENNLQKRNILQESSSEVGLSNIKSRYKFLSDTPVKVEELTRIFKVTLPILKSKEL